MSLDAALQTQSAQFVLTSRLGALGVGALGLIGNKVPLGNKAINASRSVLSFVLESECSHACCVFCGGARIATCVSFALSHSGGANRLVRCGNRCHCAPRVG